MASSLPVQKTQNGAQVTMKNHTKQTMKFDKYYEWSGKVAPPGFPESIQVYSGNNEAKFDHLINDDNNMSMAAVIYSGFNLSMQPWAWLLGWLAPANSTPQFPNKVYVTCGPKDAIDAMTEDQIRMLVENGSPVENDQVPFMATVEADFGLQNGAQVTVKNHTEQTMKFHISYEWSGKVVPPGFPESIQVNNEAKFDHLINDDNNMSKAAVIYSGFNSHNEPCAWLLGWLAPADSTQCPNNKVYVACGPIVAIEAMTEDQIRMLVENGSADSNATDITSKTTARATIKDQVPFMATVEAEFGLLFDGDQAFK